MERSQRQDRGLICEYEGCGKRCKTKGGLTIHQKRMHREGEKVMYGETYGHAAQNLGPWGWATPLTRADGH